MKFSPRFKNKKKFCLCVFFLIPPPPPLQARRSWWPLLRTQWPSPADGSTLALHVHLYHCADTKPASLRVPAIFVLPWQLSASRGCGSRLTLRLQHPILSTLQFCTILLPVGSPDSSVGVATTGWMSEELRSIPSKGKTTVLEKKKLQAGFGAHPDYSIRGAVTALAQTPSCFTSTAECIRLYISKCCAYCHQVFTGSICQSQKKSPKCTEVFPKFK